jgi:hypothetical protein
LHFWLAGPLHTQRIRMEVLPGFVWRDGPPPIRVPAAVMAERRSRGPYQPGAPVRIGACQFGSAWAKYHFGAKAHEATIDGTFLGLLLEEPEHGLFVWDFPDEALAPQKSLIEFVVWTGAGLAPQSAPFVRDEHDATAVHHARQAFFLASTRVAVDLKRGSSSLQSLLHASCISQLNSCGHLPGRFALKNSTTCEPCAMRSWR